MLPTGDAVKAVYLDSGTGVLAGVKAIAAQSPVHKLIVECGTIESATILEVGSAADKALSELPSGSVLGESDTIVAVRVIFLQRDQLRSS